MICLLVIEVKVFDATATVKTVPPSLILDSLVSKDVFSLFPFFLLHLLHRFYIFYSLDTFSVITIQLISLVFKQDITYMYLNKKILLN